MSASPPLTTAGATFHSVETCQRRTHARQKKLVSSRARSGSRAADQPHRARQSHARTVRIGRERLIEGANGGRDDFCWLVAQPTVHGADLGRLNHSLLQPPAGSDIKVHVEFFE